MVITSSGYAVLPPLYESVKEFKALLNDPRLTENLTSGEPILAIEKEYTDFTVTTNEHTMKVKVVYEEMARPGPNEFHLEFSTPIATRR